MYPTSITNKIDLSSSVSQLLKKEDTVQKTDIYIRKVDSGFQSEPIDGNMFYYFIKFYYFSFYVVAYLLKLITFVGFNSRQ